MSHKSVQRSELISEIYRRGNFPFTITTLMRTESFRQRGGFCRALPYVCENDFYLRSLCSGGTIVFVPQELFSYRRHAEMTTLSLGKVRMEHEFHYVLARNFPEALPLLSLSKGAAFLHRFRRALRRLMVATFRMSYPLRQYWRMVLGGLLRSGARLVTLRRHQAR